MRARYRIEFSTEEVGFVSALVAIAESCGATWSNNDHYGFIETDEDTDIEHLEEMLDEDDLVVSYSCSQE